MGERENDEGAALECPSDLIGADGAAALAQGQALLHDFPPGLDGELVEPGLVGHEPGQGLLVELGGDRKSTRLNSSHVAISYAVFCLKQKHVPLLVHQLA